ncbi:S8 family peptidase [Clostridium sartagoforme]|jgi:subtilisin family serine protease|uniref:S8 family peptidase n=1 Tax=Clostridium sartagoforme TaxID=84031 RepID=UPI0031E3DD1B
MENTVGCKNYLDENSPGYVVEYRGNFKDEIDKVDYACGDIITENLAVVSVSEKNLDRLRNDVPSIAFVETRGIYVLQDIPPVNIDSIYNIKINPYLNLTGKGVTIGIIDTGIDYLNKEFIREDGTSRIIKIWDQTVTKNTKGNVYIGSEYSNDDINRAIANSKKGLDPYEIVPSKDEVGHGTSMAGIIGARGYNPDIEGVANDCEFIIVKLLPSPNYQKILRENNLPIIPAYNSSEVLSSIEYLRRSAYKLRRPIILYLGVGSYNGSHDGYNITSRFITSIARKRDIVFVNGTGNAGNDEGHATNFISNNGEIKTTELLMAKEMKIFTLHVWIQRPNKMALNIIAPSGEESGFINPNIKSKDNRAFYLINTKVEIICYDPESYTGHQVFILNFTDIKPGIWMIKMRGQYIANGRYDIWLPDKHLLPNGTKFLNSNPDNTLTIPSMAKNLITVSYYDGTNNSLVSSSGRGFNTNGLINPDIATEGINILTISAGSDKVTKVSGSSAATAIVVGVCALLIQWAISDGNDLSMYSIKLRSLLIYAADRDSMYEYPNESLGYGKLNLQEIFKILGGNYRINNDIEYLIGNLFVRIPNDIINNE